MDTKASKNQLGAAGNIHCKGIDLLDKKSADTETDDMMSTSPSTVDNIGFALSPITPDSNKEGSELSAFTSPLSTGSDSQMVQNGDNSYMNEDDDCPSTPKAGVFDPFASGPDNLLMAPLVMKNLEELRCYVARRLNFNSLIMETSSEKGEEGVCEDAIEDDVLLVEALYECLLEAIICKQAEDIISEMSASRDELKTPPLAPRLTGVAETCPAAPLKAAKKLRNIDFGLCRRLEFDF